MTQKDLKYLVAETIGAQSENKEIVFRILTKKIANQLQPGEAVRIKNVGTFNKPKEESTLEEGAISSANKLIFVPTGGESDQAANSLFTTIPISSLKDKEDFSAENIFEVGVSKPLASIRSDGEGQTDSLSLKEIDKRVDELLDSSEKIEDFSIWSKSIDEAADSDDNIFNEPESTVSDSSSDTDILGVSSLAAGSLSDEDDSLDLPDFESMEKDFISEIKSSGSDEKIDIVSEDDIIVPGEKKDEEIVEEVEENSDNIFTDTEPEQGSIESDELEEESLDDIFNEFKTENSQVDFKEFDAPDLEDSKPDEENIEESDTSLSLDEAAKEDELNEEHDPEVLALDSEETVEDEIAELDDPEIAKAIEHDDTSELDALFDDAEEKITSIDEEQFKNDQERIEGELSDLETDLEEIDEDFDLTKDEYEIEHPDLEKEGIEITSASIDDLDLEDVEDVSEIEAKTNIDEEEVVLETGSDIRETEDLSDEITDSDEKELESSLDENKYSKLSSGADHKTGGIGKGFWISIILFIVVVAVSAYLYLFVFNSDEKGESVTENKVVEQPVNENEQSGNNTNDAAPPEAAIVEQDAKDPVKQEVPKKREVVRIQGKGNKGLYRDGTGERLISNRIFENKGAYSVQVSSFKTQSVAEKDAQRLRKLGHDAFIVKAFVAKLNAEYFRVRVGYFNTQKQAEEFAASFKR